MDTGDPSGLQDPSESNAAKLGEVIEIAQNTPTIYFGAGNACHKWVENAREEILKLGPEYYDNDFYEISWAEWRIPDDPNNAEHAGLLVELPNGTTLILDNGAIGGSDHVGTPNQVPPSWTEDPQVHGAPLTDDHNRTYTWQDVWDNMMGNLGLRRNAQ